MSENGEVANGHLITFLLGAGASANALPTVKDFPDRVEELIVRLNSFKEEENAQSDNQFVLDLETIIDALQWMSVESKKHASVDTFAKKLYLRRIYGRGDDYKKLKAAMSVFFVLEQAGKAVDKRYDAFFASLLSRINGFPEEIRVLTWNYDFQLEQAYSQYLGTDSISACQETLRIAGKGVFEYSNNPDNFRMFKLNGTAAFKRKLDDPEYGCSLNEKWGKTFLEKVISSYAFIINENTLKSALSFAWEEENDDSDNSWIKKAAYAVKDTSVLVVIGYSFPFFNRSVDRKIIGSMKNLKKVYFQDPAALALKEKFRSVLSNLDEIELVPIDKEQDQFFLPYEL